MTVGLHDAVPAPEAPPAPERLPLAAWALGAACLAGQLVLMADVGVRPMDGGWVPSMALGAVLVGWVAAGVLAARSVRLVLVGALFVLIAVVHAVAVVDAELSGGWEWPVAHLTASVLQLAALTWFTRTSYFAWQRDRPELPGPRLTPLVVTAVLVGVLAGMTAPPTDGVRVEVNL